MNSHLRLQSNSADEGDLESDEAESMDPITGQGGMGGGGGIDPLQSRAVRRSVYERSGIGGSLPSHFYQYRGPRQRSLKGEALAPDDPISSDQGVDEPMPVVNYKHLYIVHRKLERRFRDPARSVAYPDTSPASEKLVTPVTLEAMSSIEAGGLPGHSEIIYALDVVRHPMDIVMDSRTWGGSVLSGPYGSLMTLSRMSRSSLPHSAPEDIEVVSGRDWILSGSRDMTIRLWTLSTSRPRVVKVFQNGHEGSVLSIYTYRVPLACPEADKSRSKLMAVSGGNDGTICLWDIEAESRDPIKIINAHDDAVLCVRGDSQRVVSCSRGE